MSLTEQDISQECINQDNDCTEEGEIVEDCELGLSYDTVSSSSLTSLNNSIKKHNFSSNGLNSIILLNKDAENTDHCYKKSKRKRSRYCKDNSSRPYKVDKQYDRYKKAILNHTKDSNVISERRTSKSIDKTPEIIFLSDDERLPTSHISTRRGKQLNSNIPGSTQEKENSVSHHSSKLDIDYSVPKTKCKHKKHVKQVAEYSDHNSCSSRRRDKVKPQKHKEYTKDAAPDLTFPEPVYYSHSSSRPKSSIHRHKSKDQFKTYGKNSPEIISFQNLNRFKDNTLMRKLLESGTIKRKTPPPSCGSDLNCEVGSISSVSSPEFNLFEDIHLNSEDLVESKESVKSEDEKINCTFSSDSEIEVIIPEKKEPELIELRSDSDSEHVIVVESTENTLPNQVPQRSSSIKEIETNSIDVQENDSVNMNLPLLPKEVPTPDDISQSEDIISNSEHQININAIENPKSGEKEDVEVMQLRLLALRSAVMKKHIGRLQKRGLAQSVPVDEIENGANGTHEQPNIEQINSPSYSAYCPSDRTSPLSPTISSCNMSVKDDNIVEEQDMEIAATDEDENCIEEQNGITSCLLPESSKEIDEFHLSFHCDNATSRLLDADCHSADTADSCCNFNEVPPQPLPPGVDISSLPPEFTHSVSIRPENIYNSYVNEECQQSLPPNAECDLSSETLLVGSNDNRCINMDVQEKNEKDQDFLVSNVNSRGNSQSETMDICEQVCDNAKTDKNSHIEQILENENNINDAFNERFRHFEPITSNNLMLVDDISKPNAKSKICDYLRTDMHLTDSVDAPNNNSMMNEILETKIDECLQNNSLCLTGTKVEGLVTSLETDHLSLDSTKASDEIARSQNVKRNSEGVSLLCEKEDDEDEDILRAELLNSLDSIRTKSSVADFTPVETPQPLNPIKVRSKLLPKKKNIRLRVVKKPVISTSLSDCETSSYRPYNFTKISFPEENLRVCPEKIIRKLKKPLITKRKVIPSNPVISNCSKFIIKVGEDSDSGEDPLATPNKTPQAGKNVKKIVNIIHANNHERLTVVPEFEEQVDLLLKQVREKHEVQAGNKSALQKGLKTDTSQPRKKLIPASMVDKQDNLTPLAVRHLPKSQQEEYRRLKQQILEKERLKQLKLIQVQQAKEVPTSSTKCSIETNNRFPQNKSACEENESRRLPKVIDNTKSSCSKCSGIDLAQTLRKQESFKLLNNVETQLVNERQSVLESLTDIDALLNKMSLHIERYNSAQFEVTRLKEQLKSAENSLENSVKDYIELKNSVGGKYKKLLEGRLKCSRYSKTCKEVGSQVVGSQYVLPKCLESIMKNKSQEIAKKKEKYLINLVHSRKSSDNGTTNHKSTSTVTLPESDNCGINENIKRLFDDSSNDNVEDHQHKKRLKQDHNLIKSHVNSEDTTRISSSKHGNNVLDYISPLYHLSGDGCSRGILKNKGKSNHDAILCPYDLKGSCLDDKCPYQH